MFENFRLVWEILEQWWWTFTPIVLFFILFHLWIFYIQRRYASRINWKLLEITIPREVFKSPKAMEQVFANIHGVYSERNLIEKYIDGEIPTFFSFEMAGISGETHFFIRTPEKFRNLIESQIYAQYAEAEIKEVEDYTRLVPPDIPNKDYNVWGTDMILTKPDAYPIRSYIYFEETLEEKRIDPLSSLTEVFSRLQKGEQLWVQFIISPTFGKWEEEGQKLVSKLIGRKEVHKKGILDEILEFFTEVLETLITGKPKTVEQSKTREEALSKVLYLSPGERDAVKAIEENIAKLGFITGIRFVYIAPQEIFNKANVAAMFGVFNQFSTQNLNGFKKDSSKTPSIDYLFKNSRNYLRKRSIFTKFKNRDTRDTKKFILNIEELATVYHIPGKVVSAPFMPRIEAKKGEPPSSLPIE